MLQTKLETVPIRNCQNPEKNSVVVVVCSKDVDRLGRRVDSRYPFCSITNEKGRPTAFRRIILNPKDPTKFTQAIFTCDNQACQYNKNYHATPQSLSDTVTPRQYEHL